MKSVKDGRYVIKLNTGTCLRQGDLFYSAGPYRNHVLATANIEKKRDILGKMQVNGPEG